MWKYCDSNCKFISLHDCHATEISFEKGILTLVFDDGIWLTEEHPSNSLGKTVRTDRAEVQFHLTSEDEQDISIWVFEEKIKMTFRKEWELSRLMKSINSGKSTLEFLYRYEGECLTIFECCLWSSRKPYCRECELNLPLTKTIYFWNSLCEDKTW
jgi:hypothetical protein